MPREANEQNPAAAPTKIRFQITLWERNFVIELPLIGASTVETLLKITDLATNTLIELSRY
jgi:hypothetical protein